MSYIDLKQIDWTTPQLTDEAMYKDAEILNYWLECADKNFILYYDDELPLPLNLNLSTADMEGFKERLEQRMTWELSAVPFTNVENAAIESCIQEFCAKHYIEYFAQINPQDHKFDLTELKDDLAKIMEYSLDLELLKMVVGQGKPLLLKNMPFLSADSQQNYSYEQCTIGAGLFMMALGELADAKPLLINGENDNSVLSKLAAQHPDANTGEGQNQTFEAHTDLAAAYQQPDGIGLAAVLGNPTAFTPIIDDNAMVAALQKDHPDVFEFLQGNNFDHYPDYRATLGYDKTTAPVYTPKSTSNSEQLYRCRYNLTALSTDDPRLSVEELFRIRLQPAEHLSDEEKSYAAFCIGVLYAYNSEPIFQHTQSLETGDYLVLPDIPHKRSWFTGERELMRAWYEKDSNLLLP